MPHSESVERCTLPVETLSLRQRANTPASAHVSKPRRALEVTGLVRTGRSLPFSAAWDAHAGPVGL